MVITSITAGPEEVADMAVHERGLRRRAWVAGVALALTGLLSAYASGHSHPDPRETTRSGTHASGGAAGGDGLTGPRSVHSTNSPRAIAFASNSSSRA
ncbi:hypothetical protein BLA24_16115 [Streptomyces cinnamoneus]|uniref:Uncharacterized protein n=1 Tax=Streptomyces cinnamoneus TaxID=53446 RepID=A0A2G1XJ91_STRCJ|nr:hypothetical protein [Streptomyces cinnamoneus]PHQ51270.1 hypothetical protein BLA24_16115 [Streptomyces cinnamoneus]PPT13504.1 hypothetical protein CYQ11_11960 [Streptomyces cinnamoneus]